MRGSPDRRRRLRHPSSAETLQRDDRTFARASAVSRPILSGDNYKSSKSMVTPISLPQAWWAACRPVRNFPCPILKRPKQLIWATVRTPTMARKHTALSNQNRIRIMVAAMDWRSQNAQADLPTGAACSMRRIPDKSIPLFQQAMPVIGQPADKVQGMSFY